MASKTKPNGYWNLLTIQKEAQKYSRRNEFRKGSGSAYCAARRLGILDDVCSHMGVSGDKFHRGIYVYEFEDNSVYVGLTYDYGRRCWQHQTSKGSSVYQKLQECDAWLYEYNEFLPIQEAQKEEARILRLYKDLGWDIVNKYTTGALGGSSEKWSSEKIEEAAKRCSSIKDFKQRFSGAYRKACVLGIREKVCSHLKRRKKPNGYWTKEKCIALVKELKTLKELRDNYRIVQIKLKEWGLFDKECSHLKRKANSRGYWTKKRVMEEAKKFNTRIEFQRGNLAAYTAARSNRLDIMDEVCAHME